MPRNPRYDVLFEPMRIGGKVARNRFFQTPHCNGGGYRDAAAAAAMRGVKAEGGWGVVFTEQCEIHQTSEIAPFIELRLWEDQDVPMLAKMADSIKQHGALAGIQLAYSGINGPNLYTREVPLAPTALPIRTFTNDPVQARAMSKRDIANLRRWFVAALLRARRAGFDIVCLYGAHGFGVFQHFLSRATNQRADEYGGSLRNRARIVREVIADARDAAGDDLAISLRLSLHETLGDLGFSNAELRDFIAMHADLPDLWDLAHGAWEDCSLPSRFGGEATQEDLARGIKDLTSKPVVGVGRFTSPDTMARQIKSGLLDFIGCARPSIADPFLPNKIDEGREDDIRECIGCNICIAGDMTQTPARCTQNPTFMEEWRKGWHPQHIASRGSSRAVLVVGGGPAGLEAALAAAQRGYEVTLAEAAAELGGRVLAESKLPGLAAWRRVLDYRAHQLRKMGNVLIAAGAAVSAAQVLEFGLDHVALATGARWRADGVSRQHIVPIAPMGKLPVYTPDDLMAGDIPRGRVVVFDDDHYYMGSVLAELLAQNGARVTLICPAARVADWSYNTLEQAAVHKRLLGCGVDIRLNRGLAAVADDCVVSDCVFGGAERVVECDALVMVASRAGNDALWRELQERESEWADFGIRSIKLFGDAEAPGPIAWATYAGHRYARELDAEVSVDAPAFRRQVVS